MPELPSVSLPNIADEIASDDAAGAKFKVTRVILDGVTLLPQAEIEAQLAGLVGQDVSLCELRKAAAGISSLYRDKGYFLARAYVPAQEISGGVVRMAVLEGRYDRVAAKGSPRLDSERVQKVLEANGVTALAMPGKRNAFRVCSVCSINIGFPFQVSGSNPDRAHWHGPAKPVRLVGRQVAGDPVPCQESRPPNGSDGRRPPGRVRRPPPSGFGCEFRRKLDTDSSRSWTVIPRQAGQ